MTHRDCASPLPLATLAEYWLGELGEARAVPVEEHLLGCGHCSAALQELVDLGGGIRALLHAGAVRAVVPGAFLEQLSAGGLRLREYRVPRNGSVNCTVAPEDDLVITRLEAPLAGVEQVDLVLVNFGPEGRERVRDIPFDSTAGEVVLAPRTDALRVAPALTARAQVVAVARDGERVIGEYTFHHTPWKSSGGPIA